MSDHVAALSLSQSGFGQSLVGFAGCSNTTAGAAHCLMISRSHRKTVSMLLKSFMQHFRFQRAMESKYQCY